MHAQFDSLHLPAPFGFPYFGSVLGWNSGKNLEFKGLFRTFYAN